MQFKTYLPIWWVKNEHLLVNFNILVYARLNILLAVNWLAGIFCAPLLPDDGV